MTISKKPSQESSAAHSPGIFSIPARPVPSLTGEQNLPVWQKKEPEAEPRINVQQDVHSASSQLTLPEQQGSLENKDQFAQTPRPLSGSSVPLPLWQQPVEAEDALPQAQSGTLQAEDFAPTWQEKSAEWRTKVTMGNVLTSSGQLPVPALKGTNTRRKRGPLFIMLAILVVVGGLLGQHLLTGGGKNVQVNEPWNFPANGPYAQLPLSASQINAIQHLSEHMKYKALASLYVSHMSLADKLGQLIMVEYNQSSYSSDLDYMINTLHVGGVIMYAFQMQTFNQTKNDIARMQQRANIPLLVSTDEEGGPYVERLGSIYGYRMDATQIEESGSVDVAAQQGLKVSKDLAALGINMNLAPDVDVNQVNGYDMVTRTFGNGPDDVIKYAGPYLQAMQGNGTIGTLKHFPGLGGAEDDAHKLLPVVNSTKAQVYATDLAPFKAFIQSPNALLNPGAIMPTDVLLPSIDPKYPAELSPTFMTDILRDQFGYDGVVITDALYMQGITDTWSMDTSAVMALQAGDDMLLGANGTQQTISMINAIKQALNNGQLSMARIDESVARIIALKMQYHLMPTNVPGM